MQANRRPGYPMVGVPAARSLHQHHLSYSIYQTGGLFYGSDTHQAARACDPTEAENGGIPTRQDII